MVGGVHRSSCRRCNLPSGCVCGGWFPRLAVQSVRRIAPGRHVCEETQTAASTRNGGEWLRQLEVDYLPLAIHQLITVAHCPQLDFNGSLYVPGLGVEDDK